MNFIEKFFSNPAEKQKKVTEALFGTSAEKKIAVIDELLKKHLPDVKKHKLKGEIIEKLGKLIENKDINEETFKYTAEKEILRRIKDKEERDNYYKQIIEEERRQKENERQKSSQGNIIAAQNKALSELEWLRKNIRTPDHEAFDAHLRSFKINQKTSTQELAVFGTDEDEIAKFEKLAQKKTERRELVLSSYDEQLQKIKKTDKKSKRPGKKSTEQAA